MNPEWSLRTLLRTLIGGLNFFKGQHESSFFSEFEVDGVPCPKGPGNAPELHVRVLRTPTGVRWSRGTQNSNWGTLEFTELPTGARGTVVAWGTLEFFCRVKGSFCYPLLGKFAV